LSVTAVSEEVAAISWSEKSERHAGAIVKGVDGSFLGFA